MKKYFTKNNILIFTFSTVLFFIATVIANKYLLVFDVTSVRISATFNPIFGIVFGWPAIIGCAVGNLISDLVSGWGPITAAMGFPSQILYGAIPFYLWRYYIRSESHITRLDSPKKVVVYYLITLVNTIYIGFDVGFIQYTVAHNAFLRTSFFAFLNDLTVCIFFGTPFLSIFDYVYSKVIHKGKRKLSVNEKVILAGGIADLAFFAIIAIVFNIIYRGEPVVETWSKIFSVSMIAFTSCSLLAFVIMTIISQIRKKHAGLRIIEKPSGTIFVDEKKRLEFVSFPSQDQKYRVKSVSLGFSLEDAQKKIVPSYEDVWNAILSNQKGCPMKCTYCDCPSYGYYGNVSLEDLKYQIDTIISNTGSTHTRTFNVDFMRMGEPTFNPAVLEYIEHHLVNDIKEKVDADIIIPRVSTILPKNNEMVKKFLLDYCRIKNDVFGGNAELELSINTTDEDTRRRITKNLSMSLSDISEIAKLLPIPKGNKYLLSFPVTSETIIDPKIIDRLFEKEKFSIKLTPIHSTFNALDNGFEVTKEYDSYAIYEPIEKAFLDIGWDTQIFFEDNSEDSDSLTGGNLLLSNISEKLSENLNEKKRVGIVVAIEMNAIFEMYTKVKQLESPSGFKLFLVERDNYSIFIAQSGMGECAASAACQFLISKCNVSKIINFGVVGGLTTDMKKLKVCLVEKVVHYKYDCSEFMPLVVGQVDGYDSTFIKTSENLVKSALMLNDSLSLVTCCSGDKFIGTVEEKTYLHNTFGGDICDMESAGIVLTCNANKVPCILFKAVSDGLADGADGFFAELDNASKKCLKIADQILDKIANIES